MRYRWKPSNVKTCFTDLKPQRSRNGENPYGRKVAHPDYRDADSSKRTNFGFSVAEIAKKPLYRVTCGDIGTKAEVVEKV